MSLGEDDGPLKGAIVCHAYYLRREVYIAPVEKKSRWNVV